MAVIRAGLVQQHWTGDKDSMISASVAAIFGLAHFEWLAGILCAFAYQLLVCRKRRLGDAITALLFEIGFDGVAPMMPHHGSGRKAQRPALFLQTPADVDVVAGDTESMIKAADLQ